MKDIIRTGVVNFKAAFGDKRANFEKMLHFLDCAVAEKVDLLLLPELCLTGYDVFADSKVELVDKKALCEDLSGEYVDKMVAAVQSAGVMTAFGFGERAGDEFYNTAMVVYPNGEVHTFRKLHLFGREGLFFKRGDRPLVLDTPWGGVGVGICYDTYNFPELLRYYAAGGVRLYLNPTAMALENNEPGAKESFVNYYRSTLEYNVINTGMFIISSNLTGRDGNSVFGGGAVAMGVGESDFKRPSVKYYAGAVDEDKEGLFVGELNLALHNPRLFVPSPVTGEVDFRPELYREFYRELY